MTPFTQAVEAAGVSYRQADYWCRAGHIHTSWRDRHGAPQPHGHSGIDRWLTTLEARILHTMGRLVRAGIPVRLAARAARDMGYSGRAIHQLAPGVALLITDRETPAPALTWQDTEHHGDDKEEVAS